MEKKSDENPFEIWRLVRRQQENKTPRFPPYFLNIYFSSPARLDLGNLAETANRRPCGSSSGSSVLFLPD